MTELREGEHVREYPNGWVVLSAEFICAMVSFSPEPKAAKTAKPESKQPRGKK